MAGLDHQILYTPFELGDANNHHTRLRMGLSHLKSQLFTYNLIDKPTCGCGLGPETTDHYILRCPAFGMARKEMYHTMVEVLDDHLLTNLTRDSDIVKGKARGRNPLNPPLDPFLHRGTTYHDV